jgi:hypothetical protein
MSFDSDGNELNGVEVGYFFENVTNFNMQMNYDTGWS